MKYNIYFCNFSFFVVFIQEFNVFIKILLSYFLIREKQNVFSNVCRSI